MHYSSTLLNFITGAIQIPTSLFGSGPIFLDNLDCTASDTDLLSCRTEFTSLGLTECQHNQDVSVRCQGMYDSMIMLPSKEHSLHI